MQAVRYSPPNPHGRRLMCDLCRDARMLLRLRASEAPDNLCLNPKAKKLTKLTHSLFRRSTNHSAFIKSDQTLTPNGRWHRHRRESPHFRARDPIRDATKSADQPRSDPEYLRIKTASFPGILPSSFLPPVSSPEQDARRR